MLRFTTIAVLVSLCFGTALNAEQVSLKNGDRISGNIVSMDGKKLVVKTAYAGDVSIDWISVDQFASDQPVVITTADHQALTGTVNSAGNDYVIVTSQGPRTLTRADIASMRSPADQTAYEKSLHPGMLQGWVGGGNLGLAFARGNSQTTNLALGFDAKRKTAKDAWTLNAASIYSIDSNLNATTANSLQGMIRYDRDINKRLFLYASFAGGYDQLQDLDYRFMPGGGLGFHAIASPKATLDLLGGFGYTRESYSTGLSRNLATATLGNEFAYKLGSRSMLTQNFYYLPSVNDTSIYRIVGNVGIATKLNNWMTANVLFNDRYNSQPVLGNKKNDVLFTSGLGFTFGTKAK
jgi:putative salt-induced outer membrane protein YdiY